jgi:exopolyphosphatase/guanosine-5'-triphosphate,3'-diphosphate pyrophosphatase
MRTYAAVDIGSNSVRLSIGRLQRGRIHVIHQDREVTRLGEGVFRNGSLDPDAMARTITVLKRFRRAIQKHAVDRVRVVATSATRDAKNSRAFADWLRSAVGWRMEVITGLEEGRLIHLGVMSNARVTARKLMLVDLGGGSCELTLSNRQHIEDMVSLPLGAVRLTQDFLGHDPPRQNEIRRLREFIDEELSRIGDHYKKFKPQAVLATSGTAAALGAAAGRGDVASAKQVRQLADRLQRLNIIERAEIKGINVKRAEIIVAGAEVFSAVMSSLGLKTIKYLPLGLRDGMLAQMAAEDEFASQPRRHVEVEREDALEQLARRYHADLANTKHVRVLADQLFHALSSLHQLPPEYSHWVAAAAMLYEIGAYVNHTGRHRHAYYLISNSEMFGYTQAERDVIAAIARYQGKSKPSENDRIVRALPVEVRAHLPKAVMILRLAKALNQARNFSVKRVSARCTGAELLLRLDSRRSSTDLERWAVEKEQPYFREIFGRDILIAE